MEENRSHVCEWVNLYINGKALVIQYNEFLGKFAYIVTNVYTHKSYPNHKDKKLHVSSSHDDGGRSVRMRWGTGIDNRINIIQNASGYITVLQQPNA